MPDVLTTKEAADYLRTSVDSVKRLARQGKLPAAKLGNEWRFSRRRLMEWIERGGLLAEPEVDRWLAEVSERRAATAREEDLIPLEQVKAEMAR
jgi:excisionase family DNA binding protein